MKVLPKEEYKDTTYNYLLLVEAFFSQIWHDADCYLGRHGTKEERTEGRKAIIWVRKMDGNFTKIVGPLPYMVEYFHARCLQRLQEIEQHARRRFQTTYQSV